ncbi:MAG TPA: PEP-CTERM sorting domain-containing protein [Planctomycetota bacterium]|nr:PEP-CTERM sorting domain-containing protein [Planctomycetota bacterium]
MRKSGIIAVWVLVAGLLAVSTAEAISAGPGGYLYLAYRHQVDTSQCIRLNSVQVNTDWTVVGTDVVSHGDILDNYTIGTHNVVGGHSPEILNSGAGGYADLVMGLNYNNTPLSGKAGSQTMDVLKITPTGVGTRNVSVLGTGMAGTAHSWYVAPPVRYGTDDGLFAIPDPTGGFCDNPGDVVICAGNYYEQWYTNTDTYSDTDCTDNDGDAYDRVRGGIGGPLNHELVGNRVFAGTGWSSFDTLDTVGYMERTTNTITAKRFCWDNSEIMTHLFSVGVDLSANPPVGAGKLTFDEGDYAGEHYAVWTEANGWLTVFVDLNDDGDGMDNDIGEIAYLLNVNGQVEDIEFVDAGNDKFLIVMDQYVGWSGAHGNYAGVYALELDNNGQYVAGTKTMLFTENDEWDLFDTGQSIEFDMIPEPATLLLVGTGALGVLGYLRRRRMR